MEDIAIDINDFEDYIPEAKLDYIADVIQSGLEDQYWTYGVHEGEEVPDVQKIKGKLLNLLSAHDWSDLDEDNTWRTVHSGGVRIHAEYIPSIDRIELRFFVEAGRPVPLEDVERMIDDNKEGAEVDGEKSEIEEIKERLLDLEVQLGDLRQGQAGLGERWMDQLMELKKRVKEIEMREFPQPEYDPSSKANILEDD